MSESIFETFTDERGNISVRISQEVQVLTREEANRIEAEYRRMQAENAKLRELAGRMLSSIKRFEVCSDSCRVSSVYEQWMRELGIEVDE